MKSNLNPNPKTLHDFQPLEKIGQGSFSSVYKVKRLSDNKIYALKKVKLTTLSQKQKNSALNQVRILASIHSPFILEYRDAFFDEQYKFLYIVLEWASTFQHILDGGDLQQQIKKQQKYQLKPFQQYEIWKTIINILQGLNLLHKKGILHRDLKTANIFISNGIYKIGDMNVSKIQNQQDMAYTQTGTPYYASPQIWRDQPYGFKSDIWSFGCLIYQMCTFHPPFEGQDMEGLYKKIKKGKYNPIPTIYSNQLSTFISLCLNRKIQDRPSTQILLHLPLILKQYKQYNLPQSSHHSTFKLLHPITFSTITNILLPSSSYTQQKKRNYTQQNQLKNQQKIFLPYIDIIDSKQIKKKYSILKMKQKIIEKILTMPSENQSRQLQKICSEKSLGYFRNQSNSQLSGNNQCLPSINLEEKKNRNRYLSTQRKGDKEQFPKKEKRELDIIKELRKKCQINKNKLKKVNSSAQCKSVMRDQKGKMEEVKGRMGIVMEEGCMNREDQAFVSHLRKMSKKLIKKDCSWSKDGEKSVKEGEKSGKEAYRSELGRNLLIEIQNHRSIHLKKKGKSYKSKIFI